MRLPPPSECLTAVDFDLIPNKPPPLSKFYTETIEELEESESDDNDDDMEPAYHQPATREDSEEPMQQDAPFPISAIAAPIVIGSAEQKQEEASDDEDGLFAGGDEDSDGMEEVQDQPVNGAKRKLVEDDDYD